MKILVAGIIARYPFGGVAWCSSMYLLGLRALGHEVHYVEDTGECIYDPVANTISEDPAYGLAHIDATLRPHGLGDAWTFVNYDGTYHGQPRARLEAFCADAELFINLSGGSWFWRDEYARIPRKVFIDSDPAFTQISLATREQSLRDFFTRFDHVFTFGANIGTPGNEIPVGAHRWLHTWQPVVLDAWSPAGLPRDRRFTTVMTWKIRSFAEIGGNKDQEFLKVIDLPARVGDRFTLAVNGPHDVLQSRGWQTVDAMAVSRTADGYREFVRASYAEFGVAKHTYVSTRSGWFSDRTECYLASGRPAIVQHTGWESHLPSGEGLFGFSQMDDIVAAIEAIDADYARHARRAREIAAAHFDANVVLPSLLERALR
ncbi:MAG: glycosyltransferase family 1 protein [Acidobacteria bacterium]|nr:glycosyltransferase family 1 protein [Acidobacteriota bacterium]